MTLPCSAMTARNDAKRCELLSSRACARPRGLRLFLFYAVGERLSFFSFLAQVSWAQRRFVSPARQRAKKREGKKEVWVLLSCVWLSWCVCVCVCVCVCDWHPPSGTVRGTVRGTNVFVTCSWDWSSVAPCGDASCCLGSGRCFLLFVFIIHLLFIFIIPPLPSPPFSSLSSSTPLYLSEEVFFSRRGKKIGERECIPLGGGGERRRRGKRGEEEKR